jgi:hypothetical protein
LLSELLLLLLFEVWFCNEDGLLKFWKILWFVTGWSIDLNDIAEINLWKWGWIVIFKLSTDDVDAENKEKFSNKIKTLFIRIYGRLSLI